MRPPPQYMAYPPPNIINNPGMVAAPVPQPIHRYPYPQANIHTTPPVISAASTSISSSSSTPAITGNPNATIYIGNLAPYITNDILKTLLEHCGKTVRINRAEPTPQKPSNFGFIDFENPGGAHRALTMLNDVKIADKNVIINCQDKVKDAIVEWKAQYIYQITKTAVGKTKLTAEIEFNEEEARLKTTIENAVQELNNNYQKYLEENAHTQDDEGNQGGVTNTSESTHTSTSENKTKESSPEKIDAKRASIDSPRSLSPSVNRKERVSYLSKDYRPHWREREREKEIKQRERELEKMFLRQEKEWEKDEENLHTKITTKMNFSNKVSQENLEKLIQADLKGKIPNSLSNSRRWSEWKKQREIERKADEKDVQDEIHEIEMAEQERIKKIEREKELAEQEAQRKREEAEKSKVESLAKLSQADALLKSAMEVGAETKAFQPIRFASSNITISTAFNNAGDEESELYQKHKPLTKLDEHRDQVNQAYHAEARIKVIEDSKRILSTVPSEKEEIFAYPLKWDLIKKEDIIESKLRPWVRKKVYEYMGAGEDLVQDVIDYVIGKVKEEPDPYTLLDDLERFLDVEGEGFMMSMWRMLIFTQLKIENENK